MRKLDHMDYLFISGLILLLMVGILFVLYYPKKQSTSKGSVVPTATPSATLVPLKSVPIFGPQNQSGSTQQPNPLQGSNPAVQPAQSSTTNNSTTNNTTNNPPAPQPTQSVVNQTLDKVTNLIK